MGRPTKKDRRDIEYYNEISSNPAARSLTTLLI